MKCMKYFLGRIIKWKYNGITYQADPKHDKILSEEWGLKNARPVGTPGVTEEKIIIHKFNG